MHTIKGYKDEWRVQEFLLITFFISWLSWGVLILLTSLGIATFNSLIGMVFFVIGGFGPTIAAILCIDGKISWQKLKAFIFSRRKHTVWYLLIFAVLEIAVIALSSMEISSAFPWYAIPLILLITIFVGGGNEELGWRGTLQPLLENIMQKKVKNPTLSFVFATLITGVIWALWHGPLWFVVGSTQQGIPYLLFALSCVLISFWFACVYRRTHSVFYCMILHGLENVLMSFFIIKVNWMLCIGFVALSIFSIVLAYRTKPVKKPLGES